MTYINAGKNSSALLMEFLASKTSSTHAAVICLYLFVCSFVGTSSSSPFGVILYHQLFQMASFALPTANAVGNVFHGSVHSDQSLLIMNY